MTLVEETADSLPLHATIPTAFEVRERLEVDRIDHGLGGFMLRRVEVRPPYFKDYDAIPGERPSDWPARWDVRRWWFGGAYINGIRTGGAVLVLTPEDIDGNAARHEEAILTDLRINPDYRRQGIGRQLLAFAERRARAAGKRTLKIETQNINFSACRLYATSGYELRSIDCFAYPALPDEVQLIWQKDLRAGIPHSA